MELAYLGLFSKIFNWVLDKIFEPIFKWLSELLSTVFSWIFNEILSPILFPILEKMLEFAIELYMTIYGAFIYSVFAGVLRLIDYIEVAFDIFIGIRDVSYTPKGGSEITGSLLTVLIQQDTISTIFWALTLAGIGVALILAIFGTARSAFDLDFENKKPVSRVLTMLMKTMFQFFMVPFLVYFMLILSGDILKITTDALTGDVKTSLGRIVFMIASLNAAKNTALNAKTLSENGNPSGIVLGTTRQDTSRFQFYIKEKTNNVTPVDYTNIKAVNTWFDFGEFDYLIGFLAAIFLLFVLALCMIKFVQRIFEIILLYIVSPYFVSTMPLDDGERFGRWRDMFIGKCFTGFGSAIGMRLYLLICQMIMGGQIRFTDATLGSSIEIDYFMKLFFLVGGAWAVYKSGPTITSILSAGAGQAESESQSVVGGALYGHTIGKVMHAGKGALKSAFQGKSGEKNKNAQNNDPNQKFEGTKGIQSTRPRRLAMSNDPKMKEAAGKAASRVAASRAAASKAAGTAAASKAAGTAAGRKTAPAVRPRRLAMSNDPKMKEAASKAVASKAAAGEKAAAGKPVVSTAAGRKTVPAIRPGRLAMSNDPKLKEAAMNATAASGVLNASDKDTAYKENKSFRLGSAFQSTYDENGNHKIRVLGFGVDRDASGNTMAFKMPIMHMKLQRTDSNESMRLARMHIPGITRIDSNVQDGRLQYSDISVLHGLGRFNRNEDGSSMRFMGGIAKYNKDAEGSHISVAGMKSHNYSDGSIGYGVGKMQVRTGGESDSVSIGSHMSITTSGKHVGSVKIGSLEYSRSGIKKDVLQSASPGSTPSRTTSTTSGVIPTRMTSTTKKTDSGTTPGGK